MALMYPHFLLYGNYTSFNPLIILRRRKRKYEFFFCIKKKKKGFLWNLDFAKEKFVREKEDENNFLKFYKFFF